MQRGYVYFPEVGNLRSNAL